MIEAISIHQRTVENDARRSATAATFELAFAESRSAGETAWALVDPASYPKAWAELSRWRDRSVLVNLFEGTPLSRDKSVAPLMLSILPMQAPLLQLLVEIAQHAPAVVWLASALPLQDLAGTLREKLRAEMADRQLIMLRYGDPRVLPELIRVFDDVQRVHLGRGVKTWWWLDRANAIQRWQPRDSGLDLPQPGFARAAITLSDTQVGELLDASFADRVLDLLGSHHPTLVRRFDQAARYALVTELIKRARVAGLSSEFDCANFTAVAMSLGHDFAERGDWKGIMACVKAGELSFGDAIEKWEALHA